MGLAFYFCRKFTVYYNNIFINEKSVDRMSTLSATKNGHNHAHTLIALKKGRAQVLVGVTCFLHDFPFFYGLITRFICPHRTRAISVYIYIKISIEN